MQSRSNDFRQPNVRLPEKCVTQTSVLVLRDCWLLVKLGFFSVIFCAFSNALQAH